MIARELTKLHEEFLRGTASQVKAQMMGQNPRGEITLLIDRGNGLPADDRPLAEAVAAAIQGGMERMDAIKHVAKSRGLSKREVYQAVEEAGGLQ